MNKELEVRNKNGDIRCTLFEAKCDKIEGMYHRRMNVQCQDSVVKRSENGVHVIVGCDGAGTAKLARIGAEEMANAWLDYLIDNQAKMIMTGKEQLIERLVEFTRKTLKELARRYRCEEDDLASTIMAVVVNQEKNWWMSFHLGDGMILRKKKEEEYYGILSMPEIGFLMTQTYLTTNPYLEKHIRIYRGCLDHVDSFAIMTDGAYCCPLNVLHLTEKVDKVKNGEKMTLDMEDDQGIAVIYRA